MSEECHKEGDISEMRTELRDLKKIVKGNGQKGLQQNVIELNVAIPLLTDSVKELSDKVGTLLEKDIAYSTEKRVKLSARQRLGIIVTGILTGGATILLAIDMYLKYRAG